MSATGSNTPENHFGGSFGPNEWLVDEMYEKFQADPSSVDKAWWDFFADYSPAATVAGAPKGGTPPVPKRSENSPAQTTTAPINSVSPSATPVSTTPGTSTPPMSNSSNQNTPTPADPVVKPIPTLVTPGASTLETIRGVGARVVQSMEASLTVPTATSVRAVPAKLMIDNRTVINNNPVSYTHLTLPTNREV